MHWLWFTMPLVSSGAVRRLVEGRRNGRLLDSPAAIQSGEALARSRKAVAVAAHPDDLEYFCGGTLALLARHGCEVIACLATRGERGGRLPDLPEVRAAEQQQAAAILGYAGLLHWDYPDRGVAACQESLETDLRRLFDQERPDLLLTFDPRHPYPVYRHADHLAVGNAALRAGAGIERVALFHSSRPDTVVEITPVVDKKAEAFLAHASQLPRRHAARLLAHHFRGRFGRYRNGAICYAELFRRER
jgi:LmbE family N-acetylglucosaminyl deacetylase